MLDVILHIYHGSVVYEVDTRNTSDIAERQYVSVLHILQLSAQVLKKIVYHTYKSE
jgi:hypothetical protein